MSELSPETKAWIASVAAADDPSPDERARIRRSLTTRLGPAALLSSATSTGPLPPALASSAPGGSGSSAPTGATLWSHATTKLLLSLGAAGVLGTAIFLGMRTPSAQPAPPQHLPSPAAAIPAAPPPPQAAPAVPSQQPAETVQETPDQPAPGPRLRRHAARKVRRAPTADDALAAELALLSRAHRALQAKEAKVALDVAREHAQRYPLGQLREERQGVQVLARCMLGQGQAEAEAFLRTAQSSPLTGRVRKTCALTGE